MKAVNKSEFVARGVVSRRDFLRAGSFGALASGVAATPALGEVEFGDERSLILLLLVGGPSQLETFDPKPDAPSEIRGPFRAIHSRVSGVRVSEHLPRLASRLDKVAIVRSLHHAAAPIHETGLQLVQTGCVCELGASAPHIGAVAAYYRADRSDVPPFVVLPGPIQNTGVRISHGQSAGSFGDRCGAFFLDADPNAVDFSPQAAAQGARVLSRVASDSGNGQGDPRASRRRTGAGVGFDLRAEPGAIRDEYGRTTFGQSCLLARRLVEAGTRVVTVNMFDTVFQRPTWDCHGTAPFSTLSDYADHLLLEFDRAFCALVDDLERRGRLDTTMVVATGEFGRTPRLNAAGGRDHWPGAWSAVVAGGGTRGGQVIGATDRHGGEPAEQPVTPADLLATMYRGLGIDPAVGGTFAQVGAGSPVAAAQPVRGLFS
jgi:hypothetical protein